MGVVDEFIRTVAIEPVVHSPLKMSRNLTMNHCTVPFLTSIASLLFDFGISDQPLSGTF